MGDTMEQRASVAGAERAKVGEMEQVDKQTTKGEEEKNSGGRERKREEEQEDMLGTLQRNRTCVYSGMKICLSSVYDFRSLTCKKKGL